VELQLFTAVDLQRESATPGFMPKREVVRFLERLDDFKKAQTARYPQPYPAAAFPGVHRYSVVQVGLVVHVHRNSPFGLAPSPGAQGVGPLSPKDHAVILQVVL
jgi:hypothetical protein